MDARAEVPASPKVGAPLSLGDLPPERKERAIGRDEQLKIQQELIALRDRRGAAAKAERGTAVPR